MQTSKAAVWKIARRGIIAALTTYGVLALLSIYVFHVRYTDCKIDTKYLNGGEKVYSGRKYKIILCGAGGDENYMHDKIRMQIYSESGTLLAQRKFYVDWQTNFRRPLVYSDEQVTYFDASEESGFEHKVSMPPTWLDWIRARLPLVD